VQTAFDIKKQFSFTSEEMRATSDIQDDAIAPILRDKRRVAIAPLY
jgi:hypothetical protein